VNEGLTFQNQKTPVAGRGCPIVEPSRPNECCGFGRTFCVFEPAVSAKMGYDEISDHARRCGIHLVVAAYHHDLKPYFCSDLVVGFAKIVSGQRGRKND
jgi:hypothetical protein